MATNLIHATEARTRSLYATTPDVTEYLQDISSQIQEAADRGLYRRHANIAGNVLGRIADQICLKLKLAGYEVSAPYYLSHSNATYTFIDWSSN